MVLEGFYYIYSCSSSINEDPSSLRTDGTFDPICQSSSTASFVSFVSFVSIGLFCLGVFDKLNDMFDVRMMKKSFKWGVAITVEGALLIFKLEDERTNRTGIESIALSFWWSVTTVVTGGFAEIHNPNSLWTQSLAGSWWFQG